MNTFKHTAYSNIQPAGSSKSSATGDPPEAQSHTRGEGVGKVLNIPEGPWPEKRWGRGEEGQGQTESGMFSGGSDTIPGLAPAQGTQPRS